MKPTLFSTILQKNTLLWIVAVSVFTAFSSCKKDDGPVEDTEAPVITLTSPSPGSIFSAGDPLDVVFRISENDELHRWDVELLRASDLSVLTSAGEHEHATLLDVTATISYSVGEPTACILRILAEDHNGNVAQLDVDITINP